jgi:hypothetical protein
MNHVLGLLNVVGLVAGFAGAVVTLMYGLPNLGVLNSGMYVEMQETGPIRRSMRISKVGVGLIALGFVMQLPAAIRAVNH